ncbi:MAG: VCBS repeat-containing protein [Planctomycetes bacterium]|nr:VCBS repeat-containing protein [Planctomycetota bacterium]
MAPLAIRSLTSCSLLALGGALASAMAPSARAQSWTGVPYPLGTTTGTGPRGLAVGDLNHDGVPDVVTNNSASTTSGSVAVFLGLPGGGLGPSTIIPWGSGTPGTTDGNSFLADINGDANLDFVFCNGSSSFGYGASAALGSGTGLLATPASITSSTASVTHAGAAADFTGEGLIDFVMVSFGSNAFYPRFGTGSGAFATQPDIAFPSPDGTVSGNLGVEDVDNDGDLDWSSARFYSTGGCGFSIFLNSGGIFTKVNYPGTSATSSVHEGISFGDFDEDGDQDAVLVNDSANQLLLFTNSGAPAFTYSASTVQAPLALSGGPRNCLVADIDHDGHLDLTVQQETPDNIQIFQGNGDGTFAPFGTLSPAPQLNPRQIAASDMNADGQPDLVVACFGTSGNASSMGVVVFFYSSLTPSGTVQFGTGSAGCAGTIGMSASGPPTIGDSTYRVTSVNVPPSTLGLLLIGDVPSASDYLFIGIVLHVDLLASSVLLAADMYSDSGGTGFTPFPVPANPLLAGLTFHVQSVWVEPLMRTCRIPPTYGLVSSPGLSLTF